MIKNRNISLECKSKERTDAENIIKYTLLLNYHLPDEKANSDTIINSIMQQVQSCCFPLFSERADIIQYNFFGDIGTPKPGAFTYLDYFPIPKENGAFTNLQETYSLHDMILQNSIMEAYHAILTEFLSSVKLTSYTLLKSNGIGPFAALKRKILKIENNNVIFSPQKTFDKPLKATDFNKAFLCRAQKTNAPFIKNLLLLHIPEDKGEKHPYSLQYSLQYITFCNSISKFPKASLNHLYKGDLKESTMQFFCDNIMKFIENITPPIKCFSLNTRNDISSFGDTIVDGVYHYYITEKICNYNLFCSLLLNIKKAEETTGYLFRNIDTLKILSRCQELPNSFTRTYFLRYAFDHIDNECHSYRDYWHYYSMDNRDIVMSNTRKLKPGFQFNKWLQQFDQFITYMSNHIIPIYDWCFLTMLLNVIERDYPTDSYTYHLQKALEILGQYIEDNYQDIMRPIPPAKKDCKNGLDIISPKEISYLDFSTEVMKNLCTYFFFPEEEREVDLNIPVLSPILFKPKPKDLTDIQKFYIDLRFPNF